ncbi:MAG: leucine-rich repeat domain-containing protein [Clostridia bacterium]|nr:leucine-rich repeat domain-containing protein [Clostridia bacterium]
MLTRRFRRGQDADTERNKTVAQDGFSATIEGAVPAVSPRPWHDDTSPFTPISPEMLQAMAAQPSAARAQAAPSAQPARGAYRAQAGFATVGRRMLDFADNGDGTLTLARCIDPQADDLDIQFEAGACPVTAIAPRAFEGCTALRRVVLPASLKQIGERAFSGCTHLMQLTIPAAVARVGTLAFANCSGLSRVRIEPGVQALGPSCFSKCTGLIRVDVPASLVSFGGGVFFGCGRQLCLYGAEGTPAQQYAKLNGVAFDSQSWREDEMLKLEEQEDGSLIVTGARQIAPERLEIPAELCGRKIVSIAPKAFFACSTLCQVSIGANVREIGESAFFGCRSLSGVSFERGLERVCDSAFAGCESLMQVTLPWGTGAVGRMAFFGCTRLSFVKMPATTRVADFAFDGCASCLRVFGGMNAGRIQGTARG